MSKDKKKKSKNKKKPSKHKKDHKGKGSKTKHGKKGKGVVLAKDASKRTLMKLQKNKAKGKKKKGAKSPSKSGSTSHQRHKQRVLHRRPNPKRKNKTGSRETTLSKETVNYSKEGFAPAPPSREPIRRNISREPIAGSQEPVTQTPPLALTPTKEAIGDAPASQPAPRPSRELVPSREVIPQGGPSKEAIGGAAGDAPNNVAPRSAELVAHPAPSASTTTPAETKTSSEIVCPNRSAEPTVSKKKQPDDDKTVKEKKRESESTDVQEKRKTQSEKIRKYVVHTVNGGFEGIQSEFRNCRGHVPQGATRLDFDENQHKCRFQDVVCVDQTRVYIENTEEDFIHASWVPTAEDSTAIVTQLPLPHTASDFWEMVLQQNVQAILLILTPHEYRNFCPSGVFPHKGDFIHFSTHMKVGEVTRVEVSPNWTLHVLTVKHRERQKYIHLHHYTNWGHGRPPGDIEEIWQLHSAFKMYPAGTVPVIVSLSGAGRAGTFVALQFAHNVLHSAAYSKINLGEIVSTVRNGRMHAVQTLTQLQFLHFALLHHIFGIPHVEKVINNEAISSKYQKLLERYTQKTK